MKHRRNLSSLLAALLFLAPAAFADPVPAAFRVTDQVISTNPGGFTATTGPLQILLDMNFEPMIWRNNRYSVKQNAVGQIFADNLDGFDSYTAAYWTGAQVRVLRAANGVITQRLDGRVSQFHNGAWTKPSDNLLPPGQTAAQYQFEDWSKPGQTWWLCLVAVDSQGRESAKSAAVQVIHPGVEGSARAQIADAFTTPSPSISQNPTGNAPGAPSNFQATANTANDVISLSWTAPGDTVAGYRLYRTYTDPATHDGVWLQMGPENGGDQFAFKRGDLIFLTRRATEFNKEVYSPRLYNTYDASSPDFAPSFTPVGDWRSSKYPFSLVPHPGTLPPSFADAGETCMQVVAPQPGTYSVQKFNHADLTQDFYKVLDPTKTYVVEVVARQEGLTNSNLRFSFGGPLGNEFTPIDLPMTG